MKPISENYVLMHHDAMKRAAQATNDRQLAEAFFHVGQLLLYFAELIQDLQRGGTRS